MKHPTLIWILTSVLAIFALPVSAASDDGVLGSELSFQTFGLRALPMAKVIEAAKEMNVAYLETFDGHVSMAMPAAKRAEIKQILAANGIAIKGTFIGAMSGDHAVNRSYYEYARSLGIRVLIVGNIPPGSEDSLRKLSVEYPDIRIALHNHGPGHQAATLKQTEAILAAHHPHIGMCIDTGHVQRSGEDPVDWAKALKGRIYGVHLKEFHGAVALGATNKLRLKDFLQELQVGGFPRYGTLSVEYEGTPNAPVPALAESVRYARQMLASISRSGSASVATAVADRTVSTEWGSIIYGEVQPGIAELRVKQRPANGWLSLPTPFANIVHAYRKGDAKRRPLTYKFSADASKIDIEAPADTPVIILEMAEKSRYRNDGTIVLSALDATATGKIGLESHPGSHRMGFWSNVDDYVTWEFDVPKAGEYSVDLSYSLDFGTGSNISARFTSAVETAEVAAAIRPSGGWWTYTSADMGKLRFAQPGKFRVIVRCTATTGGWAMNLKALVLRPTL
jgi:sugar phosphate isomerase/epimerase